jgi:hypothetical protein
MTIDLSTLDTRAFRGPEGRLVRAVVKSPRLADMLPEAEIKTALTAYNAARASAEAAKAIPVAEFDPAAMLAPKFEAGETIDPVELIEQLAAMETKNQQRARAVAVIAATPDSYAYKVVALVRASVDRFYDALADQLDELLDRAAVIAAKLDGIDNGDDALDAGLGEDWQALKACAAEYRDLRESHVELLQVEDISNFTSNSIGRALAFWGRIEVAYPNLADLMANGTQGPLVGFHREPLPFAPADHTGLAHFLFAVRQRDTLEPHVATPSEVADRRAALHAASQPGGVTPEQSRLAREYGGNERAMDNSSIARQVRSAGAAQRAMHGDGMVIDGVVVGARRG